MPRKLWLIHAVSSFHLTFANCHRWAGYYASTGSCNHVSTGHSPSHSASSTSSSAAQVGPPLGRHPSIQILARMYPNHKPISRLSQSSVVAVVTFLPSPQNTDTSGPERTRHYDLPRIQICKNTIETQPKNTLAHPPTSQFDPTFVGQPIQDQPIHVASHVTHSQQALPPSSAIRIQNDDAIANLHTYSNHTYNEQNNQFGPVAVKKRPQNYATTGSFNNMVPKRNGVRDALNVILHPI